MVNRMREIRQPVIPYTWKARCAGAQSSHLASVRVVGSPTGARLGFFACQLLAEAGIDRREGPEYNEFDFVSEECS
jgi:hypothetical protein